MPAVPHTLSEVLMRAFSLSTCLLLAVAPAIHAQAPATNQTPMHWGPAPAVFPPGAKMAVVSGDPSKAAPFVVELAMPRDRKSTRLNSSHGYISYAVFCLKKK